MTLRNMASKLWKPPSTVCASFSVPMVAKLFFIVYEVRSGRIKARAWTDWPFDNFLTGQLNIYLNGRLRKFFNSKWRRSRWIKLGSCIPRDDPLRRRYVSGQPTQWTKTSSLQMWEFFFIFGRWNKEIWNDMYAEIKSFGDDGQEDKFAYSIHN